MGTTNLISEIAGQPAAYNFLKAFSRAGTHLRAEGAEKLLEECSLPAAGLRELVRLGLVMAHDDWFSMSTIGEKVSWLLRAVNNDVAIESTVDHLTVLYPQLKPYHLIESAITESVVEALDRRRDFIRLLICSPWIRLKEPYLTRLRNAVLASRMQYPELQIFVITLPLNRYPSLPDGVDTLRSLRELGATIMVHRKLHAKLYISEPGPFGGSQFAVFGSENLTTANNMELAIKIENDNRILSRLSALFFEIEQESRILDKIGES